MEEALLQIQRERPQQPPKLSVGEQRNIAFAFQQLIGALRKSLATAASLESPVETLEFLMNLIDTVPSHSLSRDHLARAIWSASKLKGEDQQQAALFDILGEDGLTALMEIAPRLPEIARIPELKLPRDESTATDGDVLVDVEQERRNYLLQEARNAAQVAAFAQAEADLSSSSGTGTTHTVVRKSDLQAQKAAKKAAKRAEQALKVAREAGAIVDQNDWLTLASSTTGEGGLVGRSTLELQELQQSLLPEGTRQYHEAKHLPQGTEREYGAGYEKVTIPAVRRDETKLHERLKIADVLDSESAKAFDGTASLNPMQSTVFETAFNKRDNVLVCAPTGAGKTNVALLTVVAHFRDVGILNPDGHEASVLETGHKVVYIAPMKALAQEVQEKFHSKLHKSLGIIVREYTGDMQLTRAEAESANILVTTPEKWDVVTRKSGNDENSLGNQCGLLIIDEVHLLADERGAVIESVVARLHRLVESRQRQVRIVGLSATLPNYQDVAEFLQVPRNGLFFFGPEHRPVPLQQAFVGVTIQTKDRWLKEKRMNEICYDIVVDSLKRGYQVMVFVHSRKGTGATASALADIAREESQLDQYFVTQGKEGPNGDAHSRYADRVNKSRNREVGLHFSCGLGIHHAGMLRGDRKLTEQMFAEGAIKVLCCTATLAWGVNLPAHTVVIKGTSVYNPEKGGMMDLSILDVQQIFGRAGRPQFDKSGEATLITTIDALPRYLDKLIRAVPIESNFIKQLADHLNAEVVGGTVSTISEAATWLSYTYLYVRMMKNPLAYGITMDQQMDDPSLKTRSRELIHEAAKLLDEFKMLRYHVETGNLGVTELGRVAAHYYIQAESVSIFNEKLLDEHSPTDAVLCHLICCATEFSNVRIRQEELSEVDGLAAKTCPLIKKKKPVTEPADKAYVLLQAYISRYNIRSFTLISDTNYIASNAGRVARAMFQMALKLNKAGHAAKLLRIAKSADRRIWWFQTPLRQFESELKNHVYAAIESKQLNGEGYDTFEYTLSLLDMQPGEVGQLCKWAKGGDRIQRLIGMLPYVEMSCRVQPVTSSVLRFNIQLDPYWEWQKRWHGGSEPFWLWIEDGDNNRIYHHENIIFAKRTHPEKVTLDVIVPVFEPRPKQYFLRLMSDSWVGIEQLLPVSFEDIKMPTNKAVNTDLIDLTPLPTTALQEPKYEQLFSKYETFNPIQTQVFHVVYHSDTPVFLGAPTGSGKTAIAELALLRMKRLHPKGICVYIAPMKSLARERLKEWTSRLGSQPLNWNILELSGDTHHDQRALSQADVLVCTPEKWDLISRGWRNSTAVNSNASNGKEFVKRVRLLVIDEIHLLGEERGAVLEAIVSRTRFISQQMNTEGGKHAEWTRIVGLSTAIANPNDLADWIGIDTTSTARSVMRGLYNFRPAVRPVPTVVHTQGYAGKHYCPRMATMNKPCYAAIREHAPHKPTLIFVASRRQTRLTALDIISHAAADENAKAFLSCPEEYIESIAATIHDDALRHTITFGIGIHHAGLSSSDRDTVERLFLAKEIRVLVATATLAWGVNTPASLVIVKGTEYFDGKTSRYVDYPLTDVLQMIGRAGRPGFDKKGIAVVMVAADKKNYYKRFLYAPFPVESCLSEKMCENLNAEISIGTVGSTIEAMGYLTWTFYARRVKANPSYYGADSGDDEAVEDFLLTVVNETMTKLDEHKCIELQKGDEEDRWVKPTILGSCASNYYLLYRTPKQMEFGIFEARKLISAAVEESELGSFPKGSNKLREIARSVRVDEISVAWILYALSNTHEFDELPVRHNEEHLNADLSEDLIWGPDVSTILNPGAARGYVNLDVMGDPHTKCFLLLQAYLERAKLPISDYVNDTKSVIDQVPRLLAAMHFIAVDDTTIAGNFDLICQFSLVRQIVSTRTLVDSDPLRQLPSMKNEVYRRLLTGSKSLKLEMPTLWSLRSASPKECSSKLQQILKGHHKADCERIVDSISSLPFYSIDDVKVEHHVDKSTGKGIGKLSFAIEIDGRKRKNKRDDDQHLSLSFILGTPLRKTLLAHSTASVRRGNGPQKKQVTLDFDWNQANSGGGEGGGSMILRVLFDDIRGLDSEMMVSLR